MKETRIIMGMPITIEISDTKIADGIFDKAFLYFTKVDEIFSTYKKTSEITRLNNGELTLKMVSKPVRQILSLCVETEKETGGYFSIKSKDGELDPSGLVKGWAIYEVAKLLNTHNVVNYYVEAGGDIQAHGFSTKNQPWRIGIRNPFNSNEIIKVVQLENMGIATSGTYVRGTHIYNPKTFAPVTEIVSLTVVAKNVYEADRFATAAYAMGKRGITFIQQTSGLEGYMVDQKGIGTTTSGFNSYVYNN